MKITIDTTVDSQEDIRKVLQILHHVVDKKSSNDVSTGMSMFSTPEPAKPVEDTTNMMSMFSSPEASTPTAQETTDTPPDFSSLINLRNQQEEKKEDEPQLEFF